MKRSWYTRLLFSYLPVFFIIISLLVTIFVFSMAEITKKAANAIDQGSAKHVMQMVDNALENTEYQFIRMLNSNLNSGKELQGFFMASETDDPLTSDFVPARRLTVLAIENPLIDSVYMVRWSDGKVLIHNTSTYLDTFDDKDFVESFHNTTNYGSWSEQRSFRTFSSQYPTNVVSLVRPYPVLNGSRGILVVNLNVSAIMDMVHDISGSSYISVQLFDQKNQIFQKTTNHTPINDIQANAEVISENTGWKLYTKIQGDLYLQYASKLMYILWISGIAAVIGAAIYIAYVSRRNYKPLLKLTEQIESYSMNRTEHLFHRGGKDEFSYIENALDKIIEEKDDYMQQKEEHLRHKKKLSLKALLDGQLETLNLTEIEQLYGWSLREIEHYVIVAEIDKYSNFKKQYYSRDQSLLKFVITNVFDEVMQQYKLQSEGDWILPNLWVAIIAKPADGNDKTIRDSIGKILTWINDQLDFTITFGMGESAEQIEYIHEVYERSLEVLQYKSSLGSSRLIGYWDMPSLEDLNPVANMIQIQQIANLFKRQDQEWKPTYHDFIRKLKDQLMIKDDTWYLLNYFIYQLSADIYAQSNDYRKVWDQHILPLIQALMSETDTLQEVHQPLFELLEKAESEFSILRQDRTYSATMQKVKQFIEEHHADPQLSLNFLSDSFQLNPKYLSRLFKEETGEKFVDYLAEVRISHAKKLLLSSDESIQNIAEQVGYNHAFSFIRAFKKMVGITPGDFRRSLKEN